MNEGDGMAVIERCRVTGCDTPAARGITVCLRHEREYDTGDWPRTMDGWRAFLAAMGGDDMPKSALPEVIVVHDRTDDEQSDGIVRTVCATCGWRGPWRRLASGWTARDFTNHARKASDDAIDAVADGRARYAR